MAAKIDLKIEQGATFRFNRLWYDSEENPIDLSTSTAKMQVRESPDKPVLIELSTDNGRILLDAEPGRIDLEIDSTDTELLTFQRAYYDVEVTTDGVVTRLFEGVVRVSPQITQ